MIFDEKPMLKLLAFLHIFFICLVRFRKVPNAKNSIKTNAFSMFLGFAQFGKQSKNKKKNQKISQNRLRTIPGSFLEWSGGKGGRYWIDAG